MCDCGHCFVLKHKVSADSARKSQRIAIRSKRALDTVHDVMCGQEQNRANMAHRRALGSLSDKLFRREQNHAYMVQKRAFENPSESG